MNEYKRNYFCSQQFLAPWVLEEDKSTSPVDCFLWEKTNDNWKMSYSKLKGGEWKRWATAVLYYSPTAIKPDSKFTQIKTKEELFLLLL